MEGLPDLAALLAAIEGDSPAGSDLRLDESPTAPIRNLRDARKTATQAERRREGEDDAGTENVVAPEWRLIAEQAADLIATKSKDLELAAWLSEALLRTYEAAPLSGLAFGFRLMTGLVTQYWPDTFPPPEDGDEYEKVRAIAQLNGESNEGTLFPPLRRLLVTRASGGESYALWQYENAFALAQKPEEQRLKRISEGALTVEMIEGSANLSSTTFYQTLVASADEALAALNELDQVMTEKCGAAAPSLSRLRGFLEGFGETVRTLGRNKLPIGGGTDAATEAAVAAVMGGATGEGGGTGGSFSLNSGDAAQNREAALRALEQIADFFRRTEPHSIVSYTLQDAVRRARMDLPALMAELLGDDTVRKQFFANAGFRLDEPAGESSGY